MKGTDHNAFVQDRPDEPVEVCAGCGAKGFPHAPLAWKIENALGFPTDLYCDVCHWEFRKTEFAEEAVIQTLKRAGLNRMFTLEELQRALDSMSSLTPEAFAAALERGNIGAIERRRDEEMQAAYGPLGAWGVEGKRVA